MPSRASCWCGRGFFFSGGFGDGSPEMRVEAVEELRVQAAPNIAHQEFEARLAGEVRRSARSRSCR